MNSKSEPYKPINCNFYDYFEAAIVQRKKVFLKYADEEGNVLQKTTLLKDLETVDKEEFLILENNERIRLDRVLQLDN